MPNLYIISFSTNDIFHIVTSNNITRYLSQMDMLSHIPLDPHYKVYAVSDNTLDIIREQFKLSHIRHNWFTFDQTTFNTLLETISTLLTPLQNTTITKKAEYQCNHCQQVFTDRRAGSNHLALCQNKYTCSTCQKTFNQQKRFTTHLANCSSLVCQNCHKIFTTKQSLTRHTDNCGNFTCMTCNASFTSKYKYSHHVTTQH